MIIKNYKLLECIESAITEYNNQFWKEEDEDKKIDLNSIKFAEDYESADVPKDVINRIDKLRVPFKLSDFDENELRDFNLELSKLLDNMHLKLFAFSVLTRGMKPCEYDISFLEHLNQDVENLDIAGVDLSNETSHRFQKYNNLKYLCLRSCNISNPAIISEINPKVLISIEGNNIAPEYYKDALNIIQKSNGKIRFSDRELKVMAEAYSTKRVSLNDYLRLMEYMDFDSISGLTIEVEEEQNFEEANSEQKVNMLNGKNNISLKITHSNLSKLDSNGTLTVPTRVVIKNASELSVEELAKYQCVTSVQMSDGNNTMKQQGEPYSREEYENVRKEIDYIISQVEIPDESDQNREKQIFSQVYKILGQRIDYDYNAISKAEEDNERLQITCRNLIGGLLENKCVCAGYSDILRNVLACTGIHAEYISGMPDFENGFTLNLNDPAGHAWNLVNLDGENYWADLTWDANYIKTNRFPLPYCLKSTSEFKHDGFKMPLEYSAEDPCIESISEEEQIRLFTGKELDSNAKLEKEEQKNIGYLSCCVMSIADSGLTSARVRRVANEVNKSMAIKTIAAKEMGDIDGRG